MIENRHRGQPAERRVSKLPEMAELPDLAKIVASEKLGGLFSDTTPDASETKNGSVSNPVADEPGAAKDGWENLFPGCSPLIRLIDAEATERAYAVRRARYEFGDGRRLESVMQTLRSRGEFRRLAVVGNDWRQRLDDLEASFPTFWEVIDYLRVMYTLAEHGTGALRLDPILLNGPPGCGKSYFAECLGKCIGAGF